MRSLRTTRTGRLDGSLYLGSCQGILNLSVRTPSSEQDAGKLVQAIVKDDGTAGRHGTMAGGQIPLKRKSPEQVVSQL